MEDGIPDLGDVQDETSMRDFTRDQEYMHNADNVSIAQPLTPLLPAGSSVSSSEAPSPAQRSTTTSSRNTASQTSFWPRTFTYVSLSSTYLPTPVRPFHWWRTAC